MPESYATEHLVEKIRHGQILTVQDLSDSHGGKDSQDPYVKIVDRKGNLIAIVKYRASSDRLNYCCVFVKPDN